MIGFRSRIGFWYFRSFSFCLLGFDMLFVVDFSIFSSPTEIWRFRDKKRYLEKSVIPWTSVPAEEKQPYSIVLPPPCSQQVRSCLVHGTLVQPDYSWVFSFYFFFQTAIYQGCMNILYLQYWFSLQVSSPKAEVNPWSWLQARGGATPWAGNQYRAATERQTAIHTHNLTYGEIRVAPNLHVLGL